MYLILVIAAAASLLAIAFVPMVAMHQGFSLGIGALAAPACSPSSTARAAASRAGSPTASADAGC